MQITQNQNKNQSFGIALLLMINT